MRGSLFATAGLALVACAALLLVVLSPSAVRRTSALQLEEVLQDGRVVQLRERQERRPMMVDTSQRQSGLWRSQAVVPGMMEPRMMLVSNKREVGQCFADESCGTDCHSCPGCQCLMQDGRHVECEDGQCECTSHCFCEEDDGCAKVCSMDYTPELCGETFCRSGVCKEAFDLGIHDPDYRLPNL
ncbi:hypothetical protein T484DRAFT_2025610 [Baffinella frigidus]|nr:hypothetical protein T484DRAFT_2025610 [Cryptophyta sp. CCMP2293]